MTRVAIITGASRGIGYATARRFAEAHWHVITCSRTHIPKDDFVTLSGAKHIYADLSDEVSAKAAIAKILDLLPEKRIHALVNNAGASPKTLTGSKLGVFDLDMQSWQKTFQLNFFTPLLFMRGLMEEISACKGSVVNVTSIASRQVHPFAGAAYAATKAALTTLTNYAAAEFGARGVRVNSISPGEIQTSILSEGSENLIAQISLRRLGYPEEVAAAIYFLCSHEASYINGADIPIHGGISA